MAESGRMKRPADVLMSSSSSPTRPPVTKEEDEDEQVEKFYALIGNIKAMREVWKANESNKKSRKETLASLWRPKFELEDFYEEAKISNNPGKEVEGKEEEGEKEELKGNKCSNLDLSLSL
ncbi:NRR repressor homolog 3-like [Asparagus officinalis]|uniref:NRR repressor homolog 3-like n=1 Tax=Asparagus officinalis TaxID=4686 RepID=UPI00098E34CC|nr:NRR repressor homolog 3-like [Asparagus officinalis]